MFSIIIMVLLIGVIIAGYLFARRYKKGAGDPDDGMFLGIARAGYIVGWVILAVVMFLSFTFQVGAKHYGVLTTFGKPSGNDYGPGIHLKAPWQKDISVNGRVQVYGFTKDDTSGLDQHYTCITTVIGNGTPTCVDVTVRWQVAEDQASVLYGNYGQNDDPTDHFGQAVIRAQMLQVVPIVMRSYNPIAQLTVLKGKATGQSAENASFAPDYEVISEQAKTLLQSRVDGEATIQSVAVSSAPLDSATQAKLSQFIQEQAKTRTALQAIETNTNQAQANKELESSLEKSPGLLTKQCLDELSDAITKNYALPAGFSCFGSGSVVIPAAK
jgi:regulator of protease activity HflC (stomatin/prohibitin superfamily)